MSREEDRGGGREARTKYAIYETVSNVLALVRHLPTPFTGFLSHPVVRCDAEGDDRIFTH